MTAAELETKFVDNALWGGWTRMQAERLLAVIGGLFVQPELRLMSEFRA